MTTTLETPPTDIEPEEEKHSLHITDASGDTRLMWDPRNTEELAAARAAFNNAKSNGMLAYGVKKSGKSDGEVIRNFDPQLGKIIMVRPLQGG
jgi:hypothetical protein